METLKKTVASTKKFIYTHRVAIAVTLTTALCLKMHTDTISDHNDFLKEHDLFETYYHMNEVEMAN
jgi:hypothetical protein